MFPMLREVSWAIRAGTRHTDLKETSKSELTYSQDGVNLSGWFGRRYLRQLFRLRQHMMSRTRQLLAVPSLRVESVACCCGSGRTKMGH